MSAFPTFPRGKPITNEEARTAVETELFAMKLTKPMTPADILAVESDLTQRRDLGVVPAIKNAVKNIREYPAEDGSFSRSAF
jgi:hypothetical protein